MERTASRNVRAHVPLHIICVCFRCGGAAVDDHRAAGHQCAGPAVHFPPQKEVSAAVDACAYIRFAILFRFSASNNVRRRREALASAYYDLSAAIVARTQG